MNTLSRFKFFIWSFGQFKVPMIGYLKPQLVTLTEREIVIKLKLNRRSQNHLQSMYFGALAVGADLAGGLHGFYHAKLAKMKISLAFKSFQAQFIKRPESDVYFVSGSGEMVKDMIQNAKETGMRVNKPIIVKAYTNYPNQPEEVAIFTLELSLKVISK
jgi:hypothetical protein